MGEEVCAPIAVKLSIELPLFFAGNNKTPCRFLSTTPPSQNPLRRK